MAYEVKLGQKRQNLNKQDNMKHCDKCKEAIEANTSPVQLRRLTHWLIEPKVQHLFVQQWRHDSDCPDTSLPNKMDPAAGEEANYR